MHVHGYKGADNINTPLELAIRNQTDRFSPAVNAIDRILRTSRNRTCARHC
jgi:xylulose-5-phosphate/fructose-6-phosphate phosphoketolase